MRRSGLVLLMVVVGALVIIQPALAAGPSVVTDATGDALYPDSALPASAFQDIVRAAVSLDGGTFALRIDLAAPVPSAPALFPGVKLMLWVWGIDTIPGTAPAGFPFVPGPEGAAPAEFLVWVIWDGGSFRGIVIDRRPLLTGGEATVTSVDFGIHRASVTASVDASLLGSPSTFRWVSRTTDWLGPLGSLSAFIVDVAPNAGQAVWTS